MTDYLRNTWYMFAWEKDLGTDLVARTILGKPLVLFRKSDGSLAALDDRCPHRFAPLSMGRRQGDTIACNYHGLVFDARGSCVHNPFSDLIPPGCKVQTYPVVVRHCAVWIWLGDPALADEALIPDFSVLDQPGHMLSTFHMKADYRLVVDNLMDPSHIEFLHAGSFGGGGSILQGDVSVREDGPYIFTKWDMPSINPPPWANQLVSQGEKVDHWIEMRWHAPSSLIVEVGLALAGGPHDPGIIPPFYGVHILTPENETSCHYFYSTALAAQAPLDPESPGTVNALEDEDKPMLEAIQRNMGGAEFWSLKPVILNVDAGSVRVRRKLAKMIRNEAVSPEFTAI